MAKKIKIGLAVYALGNNYTSKVECIACGTVFKYPHRVYSAIKYDDPKCYYCMTCIKKLKADFQEKCKKDAFVYPIKKKLYVGSNHRCGERIEDFVYRMAYFTIGRSGRLLPLRQCKKCGEFFILLSDAKKHAKFLQQYTLISPQTQKQIYIPYITKNMCSPRSYPNQSKVVEATPREQWAARHPYQGGRFSGK